MMLLQIVFAFSVLLVGIGLLALGFWTRLRIFKWAGAGINCLISTLMILGIYRDMLVRAVEWNSGISSDAEVTGVWTDHTQTVTLAPDHDFSLRAPSLTAKGAWKLHDWNLYLHGDQSRTMRFILYRGRYRLMTHPPEDIDGRDGDLGLERAEEK